MKPTHRYTLIISTLLIAALGFNSVFSHSGRTDSKGGHYNRKTGTYHFHSGPRSSSVPTTKEVERPLVKRSTKLGASLPPLAYPTRDFSDDVKYTVLDIIDGDTIEVERDGEKVTIRLIGVDTPETMHPTKPVEEFGKAASEFTRNLLVGESVYLRFDKQKQDKYDRLLAYVFRAPDGLFVNLEIIRQGYGYAYVKYPFEHMALFQHYGTRARAASKGLFNSTNAEPKATVERTVYITRTGAKYHRSGCQYLRKSKIPINLSDAIRSYSPCSRCSP